VATVSYKNQPAIHATRGAVPLAGTSHAYTVGKVLWPDAIEDFLQTLLIGRSLHVCCGKSKLGDLRLDLHEQNVDVRADAVALPFADGSFDTVLCDPPYNGKFQWNHDLLAELARVAAQRIIFQHWFIPATPQGRYKKAQERFALSATYVWQPRTYFGRVQVISVFDPPTLEVWQEPLELERAS
jgi:hypothetical protein